MRVGFVCGRDGATVIMGWEVNLFEEFVGLGHGGYSRQAKLFDESILVGFEPPLNAAFGLGAQGEDHVDVEFFHGAGELGERLLVP